jgi:hypothetical protein
MRFSVQERMAGPDQEWQRVEAPRLDMWVSSLPGRRRYVYAKHIQGLKPGVAYRVSVRFRWRAADGRVLRSMTRRSRSCKVPDPRPDLVPTGIGAHPSGVPGRTTYVLTVANKGRTAAPPSAASFDAGSTALPDQQVPALDPGAHFEVTFQGPACAPGDTLVATVDATGVVDEAVEADDVLTMLCPAS